MNVQNKQDDKTSNRNDIKSPGLNSISSSNNREKNNNNSHKEVKRISRTVMQWEDLDLHKVN